MTEIGQSSSLRQINFLGTMISIDILKPPERVRIPQHNILNGLGKDTGIPCPNTEGTVYVADLLGGQETHRVTITCISANKPYPKPIKGYSQCSMRSVLELKYP